MGLLTDSLSRPTAYSVKKRAKEGGYDLHAVVTDRIDAALYPAQLAEVEAWLDSIDHTLPSGWREAFEDRIELKREELATEDIGAILKDRFDF